MEDWQQRLDYLEESNDALRMQNRVLAAALKGLMRALPQDVQADAAESVQLAFEDELAELSYGESADAELFQDAVYAFFRERG